MKQTEIKVKCPCCGAEYLPAEIYVPNAFLGNPSCIEKTDNGKILAYIGKSMDLAETYICDCCGKLFKIKARVSFETERDTKNDFSEDFCSKKYHQISLFELD